MAWLGEALFVEAADAKVFVAAVGLVGLTDDGVALSTAWLTKIQTITVPITAMSAVVAYPNILTRLAKRTIGLRTVGRVLATT